MESELSSSVLIKEEIFRSKVITCPGTEGHLHRMRSIQRTFWHLASVMSSEQIRKRRSCYRTLRYKRKVEKRKTLFKCLLLTGIYLSLWVYPTVRVRILNGTSRNLGAYMSLIRINLVTSVRKVD